jgi:hypothetical protein
LIFGMLPLAFELGAVPGRNSGRRVARAVIARLMTSTLLTLVVVYTLLDDMGERFVEWWTKRNPEGYGLTWRGIRDGAFRGCHIDSSPTSPFKAAVTSLR